MFSFSQGFSFISFGDTRHPHFLFWIQSFFHSPFLFGIQYFFRLNFLRNLAHQVSRTDVLEHTKIPKDFSGCKATFVFPKEKK